MRGISAYIRKGKRAGIGREEVARARQSVRRSQYNKNQFKLHAIAAVRLHLHMMLYTPIQPNDGVVYDLSATEIDAVCTCNIYISSVPNAQPCQEWRTARFNTMQPKRHNLSHGAEGRKAS